MSTIEYDVVQPPTYEALETLLRAQPQLGVAAIALTVRMVSNELQARRSSAPEEVDYDFRIDSVSRGGTPFLIGHIGEDVSMLGRLEVVDGPVDSERPLHFTLHTPYS